MGSQYSDNFVTWFFSQQCNRNIFRVIKYSPTKHLFLMWVPLAYTTAICRLQRAMLGGFE